MKVVKGKVEKSLPYIMLISILLMNVLLCAGIISMFFVDKDTIIAGVIAFAGAVIGGAITLIGVLISIEHNQKLRMKNNLPDKISHIENALKKIEGVIENSLYHETKCRRLEFIDFDSYLSLHYRYGFDKFIKLEPEELKVDFIYIDADAYRMYLMFKNNVELLWMELSNNAEMMIYDLKEEIEDENPDAFMQQIFRYELNGRENYLKEKESAEYIECVEKYFDITNKLRKRELEFAYRLEMIYKDLDVQLTLKHDEYIEELDY